MDPNFPKQGQKYLEGRYKSSTLHFKSNEFQIKCKGYLRVQLFLPESNWGIRYWDQIP